MEKVNVDLKQKSYDVLIGQNILQDIPNYMDEYKKILLISNDKVGPLYSKQIIDNLESEGKEVFYYEIPDGEEFKKIETVLPIYDYMVENNFDRDSLVLSLGGGVVCDLSGYVASTFMRGVDFIQIPTSLLAQVDASIGGKVALNLPGGKNLIGSFYQPKLVYVDIEVLKTLDMREIKTGLAEIIKHSVLWDAEYFKFLSDNSKKILNLDSEITKQMIKRSCEIKANIVSQDEKEKGIRAFLNYGHTFGHVVENLTNYKVYRHGEAVIYGMVFAGELSKKLGLVDLDFTVKQNELFKKFNMDYIIPKYDIKKVIKIFKHDKKVKKGKLRFVLPKKIGEVCIKTIKEDELKDLYKSINGKDVISSIDIGTNSTRLLIGEVYNGKIMRKYLKKTEITRLGEDVNKNGFLKDESIKRTVDTLENYRKISDDYGVNNFTVMATSATRDADNKEDFFKKVKEKTGFEIEVISGEREGQLAFKGVTSDLI
ncbi:MAG: 3-dehydroquinate synthase, partial [Fusobacteriota bacterium]